ncbi:MAG: guanylate kinase, partial [Coriobacteriales bacterium]
MSATPDVCAGAAPAHAGGLFVISGPSGVGKGTLVARVLDRLDDVWLSVSATTRPPRQGETDGVSYRFVSDEQFDHLVADDGLLEWAWVHGQRYGTPRAAIDDRVAAGIRVILEIDPQGAFQVRERYPQAVLVFIVPPTFSDLEKRLRTRGTESDEQIARRLQTAQVELSEANEYDVVIRNDDL